MATNTAKRPRNLRSHDGDTGGLDMHECITVVAILSFASRYLVWTRVFDADKRATTNLQFVLPRVYFQCII